VKVKGANGNRPSPHSSRMSFETKEDKAQHITFRRQNQNQGRDEGDYEPSSSNWNLDRDRGAAAQKPKYV
jgi:hypothetical protein